MVALRLSLGICCSFFLTVLLAVACSLLLATTHWLRGGGSGEEEGGHPADSRGTETAGYLHEAEKWPVEEGYGAVYPVPM